MCGDGVLDDRAEVVRLTCCCVGGDQLGLPVRARAACAVTVVLDPGSSRQPADSLDGVELLRKPVVESRSNHAARVDGQLTADGGHDRLELGGEEDSVAPAHDV